LRSLQAMMKPLTVLLPFIVLLALTSQTACFGCLSMETRAVCVSFVDAEGQEVISDWVFFRKGAEVEQYAGGGTTVCSDDDFDSAQAGLYHLRAGWRGMEVEAEVEVNATLNEYLCDEVSTKNLTLQFPKEAP